jgi:nucleotide-binding universal stress UspA family protein
MKILLAVDGSACGDAAVEEVLRRQWPAHSEVRVITAFDLPVVVGMEPWVPAPEFFEKIETSVRASAAAITKLALTKLRESADKTLELSSEIIQGAPAQVIVEEAERWEADLIVMGSRGLGAWNRLVLGSVSSAVVHHAKCSVEIVRRRNN